MNLDRNILDSEFPEYENLPLYIENCQICSEYIWSLPSEIDLDHPNMWDKSDRDFFDKISISGLGYRNIPNFHKNLLNALEKYGSKESLFLAKEILFDLKQYTWAYNIVNTR